MKIVHIKFAFSKEVQAFFWDSLFQFILYKCLKYVSLIKTSFASRIFKLQNFTPPSWDLAVWSVKSREDSCLSHTLFLCSAHASIRSERTKTMWVLCFRSYYKCCDNWRFCINLLSYKIKKKKKNFLPCDLMQVAKRGGSGGCCPIVLLFHLFIVPNPFFGESRQSAEIFLTLYIPPE